MAALLRFFGSVWRNPYTCSLHLVSVFIVRWPPGLLCQKATQQVAGCLVVVLSSSKLVYLCHVLLVWITFSK